MIEKITLMPIVDILRMVVGGWKRKDVARIASINFQQRDVDDVHPFPGGRRDF